MKLLALSLLLTCSANAYAEPPGSVPAWSSIEPNETKSLTAPAALSPEDMLIALARKASAEVPDISEEICVYSDFNACKQRLREFEEKRQYYPKSGTLYLSVCERGDAYACALYAYNASWDLWSGSIDYSKKVDVNTRATLDQQCDKGDKHACYAASLLYSRRLGGPKNRLKMYSRAQAACKLGHPIGCIDEADYLARGVGVAKSESKATEILAAHCTESDNTGCFGLGFAKLGAYGGEKKPDEAFVLFKRSCSRGDAHGCSSLGWCYDNGSGVPHNRANTEKFWTLGCDMRHHDGCRNYGYLYLRDYNADNKNIKAYDTAKLFHERSCGLGNGASCFELVWMHSRTDAEGKSIPDITGMRLLRKACRLDASGACDQLANSPGMDETDRAFGRKRLEEMLTDQDESAIIRTEGGGTE